MFKDFFKNFKNYIFCLMKMDFPDLFIHFIEFIIVVVISLLVFIPIQLVSETLFDMINLGSNISAVTSNVFFLVFKIISIVASVFVFVYLFNTRYVDLKKQMEEKKDKPKEDVNLDKKEKNEESSKGKNKLTEFFEKKKKNEIRLPGVIYDEEDEESLKEIEDNNDEKNIDKEITFENKDTENISKEKKGEKKANKVFDLPRVK